MSKKETYNVNHLKNVADVLRLHRMKTPALIQLGLENFEGLEKAIRNLETKERKSLEKFFGLLNQETSKYEQYCVVRKNEDGYDEVFWKKMPPKDIWKMQEVGFAAVSKLQGVEAAYMYDSKTREICDKLLQKVQSRNKDKIYNLKMILVFNCVIRGGPNIFTDEDGMMPKEKESENNFDEISVLYRFLEEVRGNSYKVKLDLVQEFLDLLPEKQVREIFWGLGINIPQKLINVECKVEENPFWSFKDVRSLKRKIFHNGPWKITEDAIMGKKVTLYGLRTIYRKNRENWKSDYSLYLPVEDIMLPTGERVKQYSFATKPENINATNTFSDFGELLTLKYWSDHGLL